MMIGCIRLRERTHLRKIRSRCKRGVVVGSIGSYIHLGKPTTEVWRTDYERECNRRKVLGPGQLNVFAKQNKKGKK
jgi:hypothetical protein